MQIKCLETILDYKMTPTEAKAYKLCCIYRETAHEVFPEQHKVFNKYKYGKGDPRKTVLFKYCYKLLRETTHALNDEDYPLYIRAQFDILKVIGKSSEHGTSEYVQPGGILVGSRAWKRWLVWKKIYDKKRIASEDVSSQVQSFDTIKHDLKKTKQFLKSKLDLDPEKIKQALDGRAMLRWVAIGHISPYYVIMSPIVGAWLSGHNIEVESIFNLDMGIYLSAITPETRKYFKNEYSHEYA